MIHKMNAINLNLCAGTKMYPSRIFIYSLTNIYMSSLSGDCYYYYKRYMIDRILENCNMTSKQHSHAHGHGIDSCTIVASPSRKDPDYWYEWVRDSSIVVNMLMDLLENRDVNYLDIKTILDNYVMNHIKFQNFASSNQHTHVMNGECDFMVTIGEPKFNTDLTVYCKPWGRPQNDGPALRAMAMIKYAIYGLANARDQYVIKYLYDSKLPSTSLIKQDLEYISWSWSHKCFDLWEEINGHHFYTMVVQSRALRIGAGFAQRMQDIFAAAHYTKVADAIDQMIEENFYKDNWIISSIHITDQPFNRRDIDSSILLGYIHSGKPYDFYLANTVARLVIMFKLQYPVNAHPDMMLIGRYQDDLYYAGNPWVLTTSALAYFLLTFDIQAINGSLLSREFYCVVGNNNEQLRKKGKAIIQSLLGIERANRSRDPGLSFAEQIDKVDTKYLSADRLTWNYVELVRCIGLLEGSD
jgi:glucoamylase